MGSVIAISATLLAAASLLGERRRAAVWRAGLEESAGPLPPAAVIVPVKGEDEGLRENLLALASLDYPDYELIVAARRPGDVPDGVVPPRARVVFSEDTAAASDKVRNLLAGIAAAQPAASVFAFADSDGRPQANWLRALARPLCEDGAGATTGYRFYVPGRAGFWPLLRSVWNSVVLESFRGRSASFAWGGAMAITRETFSRAGIGELWKEAVSDDYALSDAVRSAGLEIRFCPAAMVADTSQTQAGEFFRFARRQLILTRVHRPGIFLLSLAATALYCAGMVACAAGAPWLLAPLLAPGMWKGRRRAALARESMGGYRGWFDRHGWAHTWLVPLSTWAWLLTLLAAAVAKSFRWRGVRYRVCNNHRKSFLESTQKNANRMD